METTTDQNSSKPVARSIRRGFSSRLRNAALQRAGDRCESCGLSPLGKLAELHHIKPISEGGLVDDLSNVTVLCPNCHRHIHFGSAPISGRIASSWVRSFARAPKATVVVSLVSVLFFSTAAFGVNYYFNRQREKPQLSDQNLAAQIDKLVDAEKKLRDLTDFVSQQQVALRETEKSLQSLKAEKATLEPLVASQRDVVNAIFAAQERRSSQSRTTDFVIGGIMGVITSVIASAIWSVVVYFYKISRDD